MNKVVVYNKYKHVLNVLCLCTISAGEGFEMDASLVLSLLYLTAHGPSVEQGFITTQLKDKQPISITASISHMKYNWQSMSNYNKIHKRNC